MKNKTTHYLFFILFIGLLLRLWGNNFGLPFFKHPDEAKYLPKAVGFLASHQFNPKYFLNPPGLTYIYTFAIIIYYAFYHLVNSILTLPDFRLLWKTDPSTFYILARSVNAFLGIGTCWITYRIGKNLFSQKIGILACTLLSLSFLPIRNSHFEVNDIAGVFVMMIAFNFIINVWKKGRRRDYLLAGIFTGFSIAIKYNMGLILVPFFIAHLFNKNNAKKSWFLFFMPFIGFVIACPWIFLDAHAFGSGFFEQMMLAKQPWLGQTEATTYFRFISTFLWGYGILPFLAAMGGVFFLFRTKQKLLLLTIYPIVYYGLLGTSQLFFIRFTLPLFPFLSILSAVTISKISEVFKDNAHVKATIIITGLMIAQSLFFSLKLDYLLTRKDTRIASREWIRNNIPAKSRIAYEGFCPDPKDLNYDNTSKSYQLTEVDEKNRIAFITTYKKENYDAIITSSFIRDRYLISPLKNRIQNSFYNSLDTEDPLIYASENCENIPFDLDEVTSPFWNVLRLKTPGPCIKIFETN